MQLSKNQRKVLEYLLKSDCTLTFPELHKKKCFKTDYALQSAIEALYKLKFIDYVVFAENSNDHTCKSIEVPEIKPYFKSVPYLESSNRFVITEKGLAYLEEYKYDKCRYWVPIVISLGISALQITISIINIVISLL